MDHVTASFWIAVGIVFVLGWAAQTYRAEAKRQASQIKTLKERLEESEAIASKVEKVTELGKEASSRLDDLLHENSDLRKQRDHYRQFSEEVIKERDNAFRMFNELGTRAQAAQQWLFRELARAVSEVNRYRRQEGKQPLQVSGQLRDIMEDHIGPLEPEKQLAAEQKPEKPAENQVA